MKSKVLLVTLFTCFTATVSAQGFVTDTIPGSSVSFTMALIQTPDSLPDFYIGTHEVTHDMYVLFKRKELDTPSSDLDADYIPDAITRPTPPYEDLTWGMGSEGGYPAVSMTQQAAIKYCQWLYLKTGRFYRLPSNQEWTAVALQVEKEAGWFFHNSGDRFHKTGSYDSTAIVHDLFGNVMEWILDYRRLKGGSFVDDAEEITAHSIIKYDRKWQQRDPQIPKSIWWLTDGPFVGFRILSPLEQPSREDVDAFFEKHIK